MSRPECCPAGKFGSSEMVPVTRTVAFFGTTSQFSWLPVSSKLRLTTASFRPNTPNGGCGSVLGSLIQRSTRIPWGPSLTEVPGLTIEERRYFIDGRGTTIKLGGSSKEL